MSKVIKFKTSPVDSLPDDLMKIGEFVKKYKVDRNFDSFDRKNQQKISKNFCQNLTRTKVIT